MNVLDDTLLIVARMQERGQVWMYFRLWMKDARKRFGEVAWAERN
jgi:hypothetical protein